MAGTNDKRHGTDRPKRPPLPPAGQTRSSRPAEARHEIDERRSRPEQRHPRTPRPETDVRPAIADEPRAKLSGRKPAATPARTKIPLTVLMTKAQKETILRRAAASGKKVDDFVIDRLLNDPPLE